MTKSELIDRLAAQFPQLVAKDAELAVKMVLDAMAESLAKGERIEIRGLRAARGCREGSRCRVRPSHNQAADALGPPRGPRYDAARAQRRNGSTHVATRRAGVPVARRSAIRLAGRADDAQSGGIPALTSGFGGSAPSQIANDSPFARCTHDKMPQIRTSLRQHW